MAGVELLYKPSSKAVFDLGSNLATDLRQRDIAKKTDKKYKNGNLGRPSSSYRSPARWSPRRSSDVIYSRIDESVYRAKNVLRAMKVPDVDVEGARKEYIQKVGRDYSTVGLTSYILAQKDAKEFRERCFHILSWKPKASQGDGPFDKSEEPFFGNRKTHAGKPRTPDEVLLGGLGKNGFDPNPENADGDYYSPMRSNSNFAYNASSPFATQAQWSEHTKSPLTDDQLSENELTIGPMMESADSDVDLSSAKRTRGVLSPMADSAITSTPEKASEESQKKRLQVVEELLEEHKDIIPRDLDVKTLGYAEKRQLLKQLGFGDDYIANRLCDRCTCSSKRKKMKLTPLEAFSMYDRQDINESMQVHKDLSAEFSRYVKSTEPPVLVSKAANATKDAYKNLKSRLQSSYMAH
ncbi:pyruvate carboxylase, putative [Babesia ovata]|uniref:Pyruvate carboxylase, putative n=1 Tax=Babesia ovata TaxID=189622 RepID=A0A2H6KEV3_9APIC|nr:pyruvate carboxylase, putative [Babesia ovata]GBE61532.1 pyruvate carboxylase, putative [Babesia ovata]